MAGVSPTIISPMLQDPFAGKRHPPQRAMSGPAFVHGIMGSTGREVPFGHEMRKQFLFDPKYTNLNHGSFGTYPRDVRRAFRVYQDITEAAPDRFMRYEYIHLLDAARAEIAQYLSVPVDECVFVQNATSGINVVLRNLSYKPTDVILYFDTIYGACEKTLFSILEGTVEGANRPQLRKVGHGQKDGYSLPCTHSDILNSFSQTISRCIYENLTPRVAIFDTVVSLPGVRFPFERLTKMCREYNILSVVDGAHGVGHIALNLAALDADFFVSNCHKWLYTPRGCAVFHVPKRNQHLIRTTFPTSHGYRPLPDPSQPDAVVRNPLPPDGQSAFVSLFQFVATVDSSAYYCIPQALKFRRDICGGDAKIYHYIREVAQRGADLMAKVLDTSVMTDEDVAERGTFLRVTSGRQRGYSDLASEELPKSWELGGLRDCALANVELPLIIGRDIQADSSEVESVRLWMEDRLVTESSTFVAILEYRGKMYTRVSGQIYLELRDFEWLADVLKTLCMRVRRGEWKHQAEGETAGELWRNGRASSVAEFRPDQGADDVGVLGTAVQGMGLGREPTRASVS